MENEFWPFRDLNHVIQFYTFIFGLWAVCATILVGMADWKNRNRILWGFLGLVFGPFALIAFLFFVKKGKNKKEIDQLQDKQKAEVNLESKK